MVFYRAFLITPMLAWTLSGQQPLIHQTFEDSQEGWIAFGQNAALRLTRDPASVKSGHSALAFDYKIEPKKFGLAILPVSDGSLQQMKRLRFWLKTDSATAVGLLLSEKKPGGGDYSTLVWSPKDQWQQIELTPADFAPSSGPKDPVDADGRLDMDQVQHIGILDFAQFVSSIPDNPNFPLVVERASGAHSLYIDDFEILATGAGTQDAIDDFHRPFLNWFTLGGAELSLARSGNPLGKPALEARYEQDSAGYVAISRPIGGAVLSGATGLSFDVASEQDAEIVLAVEQRGGVRYNVTVEASGGRRPAHKTIAFSEFNLDQNGPADPGGHVDPQKVKSISLVDISAAFTNQNQSNTLWIGDLKAMR